MDDERDNRKGPTLSGDAQSRRDEVSVKTLTKSRGWSRELVDVLLGPPDRLAANPYHLRGLPFAYYLRDRVERAETLPAFRERAEKLGRKNARAVAMTAARYEQEANETLDHARAADLEVEILERDELRSRALAFRPNAGAAPDAVGFTEGYLERLEANYARHRLCGYEEALSSLRQRPGRFEAYAVLRKRADEAVVAAYPHLAGALADNLPRPRRSEYRRVMRRRQAKTVGDDLATNSLPHGSEYAQDGDARTHDGQRVNDVRDRS